MTYVHSLPCANMLSTVLRSFRTCHSIRRLLAAAFSSALPAVDVDHPVRCVLTTVLRSFCTCHSIRRLLGAAFGSALPAADVDHSVRCVLCTVLHSFCTCNSERWPLSTAFGSALPSIGVDHPVRCVLYPVLWHSCAGHSERRLSRPGRAIRSSPQITCLQFRTREFCHRLQLLEKKNIPSLACCPQHYRVAFLNLPRRDTSRN